MLPGSNMALNVNDQEGLMTPYHRLSFLIPVLIVAGTLNSVVAYDARGISGLRTSAEGWLIGLVAAVLLNLFLRPFRENEGHRVAWTIFVVATVVGITVVGGYAFGLMRGGAVRDAVAALSVVAALVILIYRFATTQKKVEGPR